MNEKTLTHSYLHALLENMVAEGRLALQYAPDMTPSQIVAGTEGALLDVIRTTLPLERLLKTSDLVFHAEGPAVRTDAPALSAFNWLARATETALRKLSGEMFDLSEHNARQLGRALDLRLTGMAPGSLYIGIALATPSPDLVPAEDEPVFARLRETIRLLPAATDSIGDEEVLPSIREVFPDAAERDASLTALWRLSPTGKQGIHTLDMSSPGERRGTLSQRERVVLRDAIKRPALANRKTGTFTGEVREADLDKSRVHLRNVPGVGSLRCVLPALDSGQAKTLIGEQARFTGVYESDRQGRPRLLIVERVEPVPRPTQHRLTP